MGIEIKIFGESEIVLKEDQNNQGVTGLEFIFDSADDVRDKSFDAIAGLKIYGEISEIDKKETLELGKWALCVVGNGIYRKVNVMITDGKENVIREYSFSNMFVLDYKEEFDKNGGKYTLILRQKAKDTNIEIFA